ncbi:BamA/TamA family outer membrane protein [Echinicola soli]|uniref:BamA/TamA family outer membrane protein n=1 Tax=Echinicola soli TaxID=2591634 RepID=UPI001E424B5D|nr:BamA/TamA family outer membrane protein [Echinicola soli]
MSKLVFSLLFFLPAFSAIAQKADTAIADTSDPALHDRLLNTTDDVLEWMSTDTWSFIPVVTYSPETSLGLGVGAIKVFRPKEGASPALRPSSMPITFIYTLKKQAVLEMDLDLWKNDNKDYFNASLELANYPFEFYGIGNDMPADNQEPYSSRYLYVRLNYMRRLLPNVYLGPWLEFRTEDVYEKVPGGLLASGAIPGSDSPQVAGLGLKLNYDSRNDIFQPSKGSFHQVSWITNESFLGSDYSYRRYEVDLRKYFSVWENKVLAVQGYWSFVDGVAPFQQTSLLGGSKRMRGYFEGRYRDQLAMIYQAELRLPIYRSLGMVFFGSTGQVAEKTSQYSVDRFHYGAGFGFRYQLMDEGINIRIDFGFGDQTAFYFGLNEVF